jgi:hypothetical protein
MYVDESGIVQRIFYTWFPLHASSTISYLLGKRLELFNRLSQSFYLGFNFPHLLEQIISRMSDFVRTLKLAFSAFFALTSAGIAVS